MKTPKAAKYLRAIRKEYRYTQKEVARWIGTDRTNYCKKENGLVAFSADELITILEVLDSFGPKKTLKKHPLKQLPNLLFKKNNQK